MHLAEHFLRVYAQKYERPVQKISRLAYEHMLEYKWPGNVRELQNVIERGVLLCRGDTIEVDALPFNVNKAVSVTVPATLEPAPPVAEPAKPPTNIALSASLNLDEPIFKQLGRLIVRTVQFTSPRSSEPVILADPGV